MEICHPLGSQDHVLDVFWDTHTSLIIRSTENFKQHATVFDYILPGRSLGLCKRTNSMITSHHGVCCLVWLACGMYLPQNTSLRYKRMFVLLTPTSNHKIKTNVFLDIFVNCVLCRRVKRWSIRFFGKWNALFLFYYWLFGSFHCRPFSEWRLPPNNIFWLSELINFYWKKMSRFIFRLAFLHFIKLTGMKSQEEKFQSFLRLL